MDEAPILVAVRAGFRIVTLNRPQRLNAFTEAMHHALSAALDEAVADASCRALLLTGAGRGFCAGQDLNDRVPQPGQKRDTGAGLDKFYNPLVRRLHALPFPTVAAINGVAAGAGLNVALHLRHRAGGALGALHPVLRQDRAGAGRRRHLGFAAAGRHRARARPRAARRTAVGRAGRAMGPDLEGGRRRSAHGGSRETVRAFCQRADRGAGACPPRARCLRDQHA